MQPPNKRNACIALADGTLFSGQGFGFAGESVGEICFNTAMTGYQEIMTDPSYAGQIVLFTFPHIGIVGTTPEDSEAKAPASIGMITRWHPALPSNWRAESTLHDWLECNSLIGIGCVDTRALTRAIRKQGALHAAIEYRRSGKFELADLRRLTQRAKDFAGLKGADLSGDVTCRSSYEWKGSRWQWPHGHLPQPKAKFRVSVIDYGVKGNILRCLAHFGCQSRVFPARTPAEEVLRWKPDGIFLSNGPGDPAATGSHAVPLIRDLMAQSRIPIFGICLGHQLLALALGRTNFENESWASRSQSPREGHRDRKSRNHINESWFYGQRRHVAGECSRNSSVAV